MATRYIGLGVTDGPQFVGSDVVGASSGGTLAGSQNVQIVFDDAVFGSSLEGKQRLIASVEIILARLKSSRSWPVDSSS